MYAVGKLKLALTDIERSIIWYWPSVCCARSWDVTRHESLARSRASLAQGVSSGHMGHIEISDRHGALNPRNNNEWLWVSCFQAIWLTANKTLQQTPTKWLYIAMTIAMNQRHFPSKCVQHPRRSILIVFKQTSYRHLYACKYGHLSSLYCSTPTTNSTKSKVYKKASNRYSHMFFHSLWQAILMPGAPSSAAAKAAVAKAQEAQRALEAQQALDAAAAEAEAKAAQRASQGVIGWFWGWESRGLMGDVIILWYGSYVGSG